MKNLLRTRFSVLLFLSLLWSAAFAFARAPDTTGPYKVVMEMDPSLPDHTIFRPENLSSVKGKLPIVAVAHGACYDVGNFSSRYAYEIGSSDSWSWQTGRSVRNWRPQRASW